MSDVFPLLAVLAIALVSSPARSTESHAEGDVTERYQALETFARGMFYLESMYVDPEKVQQESMVHSALKGIVSKLDPHTMIMEKESFKQLSIDTQGKFGGVGIIVSQERGKIIVVSPIEDTPAHRAGIKTGDEIIAIDGAKVDALKTTDAVDKMRGEPGSEISLTIKRDGAPKSLEFTLIREVIKVRSVRSELLANGMIYGRLTSFQENTASELHEVLKKHEKTITGLILDLRDNPGGLLDQAIRVSDLFIESGVIVSTVGRDRNRTEREFAHKKDTFSGFPIVVLQNGGSASASEIVAGALQDHERAIIMGTTSFGKGSVQTLVSLPDNSGLKLTVARYYTPKDRSIQAKGITPDITVQERKVSDIADNTEMKRESDLDRHIESKDLSDLAADRNLLNEIKDWPKNMREDYQLVSAYKYLKGYTLFQKGVIGGKPASKGQVAPVPESHSVKP